MEFLIGTTLYDGNRFDDEDAGSRGTSVQDNYNINLNMTSNTLYIFRQSRVTHMIDRGFGYNSSRDKMSCSTGYYFRDAVAQRLPSSYRRNKSRL